MERGLRSELIADKLNIQLTMANNMFEPVPGPYAARGTFGREARRASWEMFTTEHRYFALATVLVGLYGLHRAAKRIGL